MYDGFYVIYESSGITPDQIQTCSMVFKLLHIPSFFCSFPCFFYIEPELEKESLDNLYDHKKISSSSLEIIRINERLFPSLLLCNNKSAEHVVILSWTSAESDFR